MTAAPVPRRGSFLGTWRLFASGHGAIAPILVILSCLTVLMNGQVQKSVFASLVVTDVFFVAVATWFMETGVAARVEFMAVVPQPVKAKWFVLAPMCAFGFVSAVAMFAFGRTPPAAALSLIGIVCWTAGATRWLRRLPLALLGLPLLLLAPVATLVVHRMAGWGAAAAASTALGLGAIAFQPRALVGLGVAGQAARERAPIVAARPGFGRQAVSAVGPARASWLAPPLRFLHLMTVHRRGQDLFFFALSAVAILQFIFPGVALLLVIFSVPAEAIGAAHSVEAGEFIRPLPFGKTHWRVGGLLFPILIALAFAALMLPSLSLDWVNGGGLAGRLFKSSILSQPSTSYLREMLGATFLPEKWPAGGLTPAQWCRVLPLLHLDLLRATLFVIAALFTRATLPSATGTRPQRMPAVGFALLLAVTACALSTSIAGLRWPIPPWWVAGMLAAIAIAHWVWTVRRVNAATGSSTRG